MQSLQEMIERLENAGDAEFPILTRELEARVLRSHEAGLLCQLAGVYRRRRLWEQGERLLRQAMVCEPSAPEPYRSFGLLEMRRDDLEPEGCLRHALELFERCVRLERLAGEESPATRTLLGAASLKLGQRERAESEFLAALGIDPKYEEALFNLALLAAENDPDKARSLLQEAIDIDPEYAEAHRELGVLFQKQGNLQEAEYHLRRAFELDPADYWDQMYLANLLGVLGKIGEAEQIYKLATESHPEMKQGIEVFACFLESIGKAGQAAVLRQGKG